VLHHNTFGGPDARTLFSLPNVLAETLILLTSSFTCGMALLAVQGRKKNWTLFWLVPTFLLGAAFLTLELTEFRHLVIEGNSWRHSGFLSAFFTLVGTHGLHIVIGLLWMMVLFVQTMRNGFTAGITRRLTLFSMFWHFLDVVWIFIFTIVYLLGAA
jgi:cytochrome o ubiquinol oxidase subunit 3